MAEKKKHPVRSLRISDEVMDKLRKKKRYTWDLTLKKLLEEK